MFELDMLYAGQTHTVAAPLELPPGGLTREVIQSAFDAAYLATYGRLLEGVPVRIMNHRVAVIGRRPKFDMGVFAPTGGRKLADCLLARREVRIDGATLAAPVYDRLALAWIEGG